MQIVQAHPVVVDHPDPAEPRRREIQDQRRAEAAGADHEDARGFQTLLAGAANLLKDQMAPVACDFLVGQHGS